MCSGEIRVCIFVLRTPLLRAACPAARDRPGDGVGGRPGPRVAGRRWGLPFPSRGVARARGPGPAVVQPPPPRLKGPPWPKTEGFRRHIVSSFLDVGRMTLLSAVAASGTAIWSWGAAAWRSSALHSVVACSVAEGYGGSYTLIGVILASFCVGVCLGFFGACGLAGLLVVTGHGAGARKSRSPWSGRKARARPDGRSRVRGRGRSLSRSSYSDRKSVV